MNPTCPNCGSDELVYQERGPLWYCRGCDSLLLEGEMEYDAAQLTADGECPLCLSSGRYDLDMDTPCPYCNGKRLPV